MNADNNHFVVAIPGHDGTAAIPHVRWHVMHQRDLINHLDNLACEMASLWSGCEYVDLFGIGLAGVAY